MPQIRDAAAQFGVLRPVAARDALSGGELGGHHDVVTVVELQHVAEFVDDHAEQVDPPGRRATCPST